MLIRDLIKRDIGVKVEGVVKVFDRAALAAEVREYVVTDKIEEELKAILDCVALQSDTLRRGGTPRDVMGIWVSGFFGSGKSHFAKVLGYLLQNDQLSPDSPERCIDAFVKHLSDTQRGKSIALRLRELERTTQVLTIPFEIKSRQSLTNPNSVGEILLSEFYRSLGLAENFVVADIERRLQRRGLLEKLEQAYEAKFGVPWRSADGRDDLSTVRRRLVEILPEVDQANYPDHRAAKDGLADKFRHETIRAEDVADKLVAWVDAQKTTGGKVQHLVFVIDEMGTFIGDSTDKISELNAIAEMIGNKGKGKVWLIVTSQQDLEKVVDRTNFQPALVGRLNARFELKPHLISDEINKVVSERLLKKHPAEEPVLRDLYRRNDGPIAQLADLKASRQLAAVDETSFVNCYPLLPNQIQLAQDIFEALSGFRISGGVRSMIAVVMESLQEVADEEVGTIVSFDQIFDAVENDLLSQEYLGASGVRAIRESDKRVPSSPIDPARVLKVLWLVDKTPWVPRVPETIAKLLGRQLTADVASLRQQVEETLAKLQEAGYVAKDEATGEWKYLNERERTIEQAIQEMVRPGGTKSISIAAVRRTSQEICKTDLITRRKLNNFTVTHGKTKVPFPFGVYLDGEAVETGPDLEALFVSPLAAGRKQETEEINKQNQASGPKGRRVWWIADTPENIEARLKRYEALVKVTADKRFTDDASTATQDALAQKRKERDDLRNGLVKDLEKAFLNGTLCYGGQQVDDPTGANSMMDPLDAAFATVIPNVYPRFSVADREFDFAKQLKGLLNPANTKLDIVAPGLDLFDTQGSLQRESALVSQVLEVLSDLEDEGVDPIGTLLVDGRDNKGFRGFNRPPFAWPSELVRLVLAGCFRAGAIYLEVPTGAGLSPRYDYRDSDDLFAKINTFKKIHLRVAEASLSVEQLKQASKCLIAMDITGTPESGNAIAAAVQKLGATLKAGITEAKRQAEAGVPVVDTILKGESVLEGPTTAKDPTKAVTEFLNKGTEWKSLHADLKALHAFLEAKRQHEFAASRKIAELAATHPVPADNPANAALQQALKDMDTLIAGKQVVSRWPDYRTACESARDAYRAAYQEAYTSVQRDVAASVAAIKSSPEYGAAPANQREAGLAKVFGTSGACHYPDVALNSTAGLLEATAKHSLTSLAQATMALPAYQAQALAELRLLTEPPPLKNEKTYEWRAAQALAGKRFRREGEVDETLKSVGDDLKARIREGFTVVVK